jgi:hypothetical protein
LGVLVALFSYGLLVDPDKGTGGIPCLWKTLFGINCPGCGLSRAGAFLLRGRFAEAARMNWLIFPFAIVVLWKYVIAGYETVVKHFLQQRGFQKWQN